MRPIRTPSLDGVYRGNDRDVEDLPFRREIVTTDRGPIVRIVSIWEPSEEEREAIANGANIELGVFYEPIPPFSVAVSDEQEIDYRELTR